MSVLDEPTTLDLTQWWLQRTLDREGIRSLAIKGRIPAIQQLRAPQPSADVDIWAAPADASSAADLLLARGWFEVTAKAPSVLAAHARAFRHADWNVEVDLHHAWPGFLCDSTDAFEFCWRTRESVRLMNQPVAVTSVPVSALMVALHALRSPRSIDAPASALAALAARLLELESTESSLRAEMARAARALCCCASAEPLLRAVGWWDSQYVAHAQSEDQEQRRMWALQVHHGATPAVPALSMLTRVRGRARLQVVWSALTASPSWRDASMLGRARILMSRLGKAIRSLPAALIAIRSAGRPT